MNKRDEIKWAPFESLFQTKNVLKELETKKEKHQKPILSEDELFILEQRILDAFHTQALVEVSYYYQGLNYQKVGIITSLHSHKIFFDDHSSLYFEQILKVVFC